MDGEINSSSVKTLSCPNCAGTVRIHLPGQCKTVVCASCSSILDPNTSTGAGIIEKYEARAHIKPQIPFGVKGELYGIKWMCLGLIIKKEITWGFEWQEYLLFNPKEGFRWLTESEGHWTFVAPLKKKPDSSADTKMFFYNHPCVNHQGRNFRLYHSGRSEVVYCLGEFYWRVEKGEKAEFSDFIRNGEMISIEKNSEEEISSIGFYIDAHFIEKAFDTSLLSKPGYKKAPHSPSNLEETWASVSRNWLLFSGLLTAFFIIFFISCNSTQIAKEKYYFDKTRTNYVPFKVAEFTLGSTQNIELDLYAPVSQSWFEVGYTLVNKNTGDSIDIDQGVEYYSGYDSDGSWSEGSNKNSKVISSLPEGTYELLALPASDPSFSNNLEYEVTVLGDVVVYSNFIWALVLLAIYPLWHLVRMYGDLTARWSESDYSPFGSGEEDDDE